MIFTPHPSMPHSRRMISPQPTRLPCALSASLNPLSAIDKHPFFVRCNLSFRRFILYGASSSLLPNPLKLSSSLPTYDLQSSSPGARNFSSTRHAIPDARKLNDPAATHLIGRSSNTFFLHAAEFDCLQRDWRARSDLGYLALLRNLDAATVTCEISPDAGRGGIDMHNLCGAAI